MNRVIGKRAGFLPASWVLALSLCATLIAIIAQTWLTIDDDRRLVLDAEKQNGLVTVRLLEEHATQTFEAATRKLNEVAASIRKQKIDIEQHPEELRLLLASFDLYGNPNLKALQYVDLKGRSWITSPDYPAHQTDVSERPYIQTLIHNPEIERPLVGHPYPSRYDSQLALPVARNLFDAEGHHIGLISVDIHLAYFSTLYARVAKENNASVSIISENGFIIVRTPFEARYVDRDILDQHGLKQITNGEREGSFEDPEFLDDESSRLYTYRKIGGFPIVTVYGRDIDSIMLAWEQRTQERLRFSGAIVVLILALSWFLQRYIRNLHRSRHSLRESEARFMRLFQLSPVPLSLVRQHSNQILEINDAWSEQYGFLAEEVVGRSIDEIGIWATAGDHEKIQQNLLSTGKLDRCEARFRHRDGRILICLLSARIFESEGEQHVIFNSYDITRLHEIEREIRELNAELEARVENRTQKLATSNQELSSALESLQAMQDELVRSEKLAGLGALVAGVAHELNTPIGNGLLLADTMRAQTCQFEELVSNGALQRSAMMSYLKDMVHGSEILVRTMDRAAELIRSFKQVAVDQTSDARRSFNLATVLGELISALEPSYKKLHCHLVTALDPDIVMESFPGPLGQVITNFVSNSIAHGFEGREQGTMHLSTSLDSDGQARIEYRDDGVGIPAANLPKVFDPFFTTKLGKGGSGLGMHIAYSIVTQVLAGTITISSEEGNGVVIVMHLPCVVHVRAKLVG